LTSTPTQSVPTVAPKGAASHGLPARPVEAESRSILRQPAAVWAVAAASVFAFMGIGLVDPILPAIAKNLNAGASEVSLLFTSYFAITGVAMLITGWVSSRIGGKKTLLIGLSLIVVFAALAGLAENIPWLVGMRAGWGLGNALFVATALAVIVGVASGGSSAAIIIYEAALGLGMSLGPLLGAILGGAQWRLPFFGTAVLMLLAAVAISIFLPKTPAPAKKTALGDPIRALGHKGLGLTALSSLCYNFGFFTVLAYSPFVLEMDAYGIGAVFVAWGVLVAVFSVFIAPIVQRRFGVSAVLTTTLVLFVLVLVALGVFADDKAVVAGFVISTGAIIGVNNTLYTELAMEVSDSPRPVASAGYNFVRWIGGALAPFFASKVGETFGHQWAFFLGAAVVVVAVGVVIGARKFLTAHEGELEAESPLGAMS